MVKETYEKYKAFLDNYSFDPYLISKLQRQYLSGAISAESNKIKGEVKAAQEKDFFSIPEEGTEKHNELKSLGEEAIKKGEVGVIILNGGMATRFGGVVKGTVEVYDKKSFLQIKVEMLKQLREKLSAKIPLYIMNSFQTEEATKKHFLENNNFAYPQEDISFFNQYISLRLHEDGSIYKDKKGEASFYGPGHGDFKYALKNSGHLQKFREQGGKYLFFSNVDNLGASLDPIIIGFHIKEKTEMTAEVAKKYPGDKGGAPAFVNGKLQVVEQFRFPDSFEQDSIPVFNANTYIFNTEALDKEIELNMYIAIKEVEGKKAIQFERLAGDFSIHVPSKFLIVPREGVKSRFTPIKTRDDLEKMRDSIRELVVSRV